MDTKAEMALASFETNLNEFLIACSELEESNAWPTQDFGPMGAYFEADLFAVTLQVMSADGVFERVEAEVLNRMFGTSYTPRELSAIFRSTKPTAMDYCNEDAEDALTVLGGVDAALTERYRNLLLEACRIVSLSDGVAEKAERMLIAQLREALS